MHSTQIMPNSSKLCVNKQPIASQRTTKPQVMTVFRALKWHKGECMTVPLKIRLGGLGEHRELSQKGLVVHNT